MKAPSAKMTSGFGLAGLVSGSLALLCMPVLGMIAPGPTFGLTIAVFLCLFAHERSVAKALVLCITSTASYVGALYSTIYADGAVPHSISQASYSPPAYVMLVGGVVGGFCVCTVALFLYSPVRKRIVVRALWCSLAGGALAVAGYALGSLFEGPVSTQGSSFSSEIVTLFLIWPAGMGAVLGITLQLEPFSSDEGYWPGSYSFEAEPVVLHPARDSQPWYVPFLGWTFTGLLCAFFLIFFGGRLWSSHDFERQKQLDAEYRAARPSVDQIPPLQPMDQQEVFIVSPIAGTTPIPIGRSLSKARAERPEFADFRICYMSLPTQRCGGSPPAIDVEVVQYAIPAWADYALRGKAYGPGPGYYQRPKDLVRIGRHILALENPHERGHGEFYWTAGSILVTVRSNISDPTPFVDAYLEKFPSGN